LYLWGQVRRFPKVILVEGAFDYAALWQAGFQNVTCAMGNRLNAHQFTQLCDGCRRTIHIAFDADTNGSGQRAAQQLAEQLRAQGMNACQIYLPDGHDPSSFFADGGDAAHFRLLLEQAHQ